MLGVAGEVIATRSFWRDNRKRNREREPYRACATNPALKDGSHLRESYCQTLALKNCC